MTSLTTVYMLPTPPVLRLEVYSPASAVPDDRGAFVWPSGARYEGEWLARKPHGRGAYVAPDGCAYDGEWLAGTPNGVGVLTSADRTLRYTGRLHNGVCDGVGGLVCDRSGTSYQGLWARGKPDGRGCQTSIDLRGNARHTDGVWQGGICVVAHCVERSRASRDLFDAFVRHGVPRAQTTYGICSPERCGDAVLTPPKKRPPSGLTPPLQQYDFNRDWCDVCGSSGNLICCDGCPAAFHLCCVHLEAHEEPLGPWYCRECASRLWARPSGVQRRGEVLEVSVDAELAVEAEATPPLPSTPHGSVFVGGCLSPRKEPALPLGPARYLHYWRDNDLRVFLRQILNTEAVDQMTRDELVKHMLERGRLTRGVQPVHCSRVGPRYQAAVPDGTLALAPRARDAIVDGATLQWSAHAFASAPAVEGEARESGAKLLAAVEADGRARRTHVVGGDTVASSSAKETVAPTSSAQTADNTVEPMPSCNLNEPDAAVALDGALAACQASCAQIGGSVEQALRLIHASAYDDARLAAALPVAAAARPHGSARPWSQDENQVRAAVRSRAPCAWRAFLRAG